MIDTFEQQLNIQSKICIENINNENVDNLTINIVNKFVNFYLYDSDEDPEMLLTKKLFNCKVTGNYGLTLFSALQTNIIIDEDIIPLTAFVIHWALTKHMSIFGKTHELQVCRGLIMKDYKKYFINTYKQICSEKFDRHTIDYQVSINVAESTVNKTFMNDLYCVKDHYSYFDDLKDQYTTKFQKTFLIDDEEIHNSFINYLMKEILSQQFE